jgi:uncharacterized membrane protein YoaK (UPF0700 family)
LRSIGRQIDWPRPDAFDEGFLVPYLASLAAGIRYVACRALEEYSPGGQMPIPARATGSVVFWRDDRHGPLPLLLLVLTMVTGLVDAVSYLKLGHVFVANMTGNVVFLGFAVADAQDFSIPASLAAIAAFMAGALAGGRLALGAGRHRGRLLAIATSIQTVLVGVALAVAIAASDPDGEAVRYALIALLALAMGIQNAIARRLGVPDLTTTVLTLTLTGLAADSKLAGSSYPFPGRRLAAIATMFFGAAVGAILVFRAGVGAVLALVLVLLAVIAIAAYRVSSSPAPWTAGS